MGDRGIVKLVFENSSQICIYSHWEGSNLVSLVREAIAKKWRWDDPTYLARIIVDYVTKSGRDKEDSWGLATSENDCDGTVAIVVYLARNTVNWDGIERSFESFLTRIEED